MHKKKTKWASRVGLLERLDTRCLMAADFSLLVDTNTVERSLLAQAGWVAEIGNQVAMVAGSRNAELWITGDKGNTTPKLLTDFTGIAGGVNTESLPISLDSRALFIANDREHGYEIWGSDGTQAGTLRLRDIYAGPQSSNVHLAARVGNYAFFFATDGDGRGLWKSDGTAAGTVRVLSAHDEHNLIFSEELLTEFEGQAYFLATDTRGPRYLVRADPNSGEVHRVSQLDGGNGWYVASVGSRLLIVDVPHNENPRIQAYSPTAGLQTLFTGNLRREAPAVQGDFAYFSVSNDELWSTDGTVAGTKQFLASGNFDYRITYDGLIIAAIGSRVLLVQDNYFTLKDTTSGLTTRLPIRYGGNDTSIVVADNHFIFVGMDSQNDIKLYALKSNETQATVLRTFNYPFALTWPIGETTFPMVANDRVFFPDRRQVPADASTGAGKFNDTVVLMEYDVPGKKTIAFDPVKGTFGSDMQIVAKSDQWTWFTSKGSNQPVQLWQTDGTPAGTTQINMPTSIGGAEYLSNAQWIRERLIFDVATSWPSSVVRFSWNPATRVLETLTASNTGVFSPIFEIDDALFQVRMAGLSMSDIYQISDDFTVGQAIISLPTIDGRVDLTPYQVTQVAGRTLLNNGKLPWLTDGTASGTIALAVGTIPSELAGFFMTPIVSGDSVWLINHRHEFYRLSANSNTAELVGILPSNVFPTSNFVDNKFHLTDNGFCFIAKDSNNRTGLWVTDGTAEGTRLLRNFVDGQESISAFIRGVVMGKAIVTSANARAGTDLWSSDGSVDGTTRLLHHSVGLDNYAIEKQFGILPDGRALMTLFTPEHGFEPWIIDGTPAGTQLFSDVEPGSASSFASFVISGNSIVALAAVEKYGSAEAFGYDYRQYAPSLIRPRFYVDEEMPGALLGDVPTGDIDRQDIARFQLHDQALASTFLLDETTGQLRLQPDVALDYETLLHSGNLTGAVAVDLVLRNPVDGQASTRSVNVQYEVLNRIEPPRIDDQEFTVDEDAEPHTYLFTLATTQDALSHLSFSRTGGIPVNIEPHSGRVSVFNSDTLDFERGMPLLFVVQVYDTITGFADTAQITVKVRDIDEPPTVLRQLTRLEIYSGQSQTFQLPADVFKDPEHQLLSYALTTSNGEGLPTWIRFDATTRELTLSPGSSEIGMQQLSYSASDPQGHRSSIPLSINVLDGNYRWHNTVRSVDVNRDSLLTPLDALLVINYLNTHSSSHLPTDNTDRIYFYDTNRDGHATALDALLIINALNSSSAGEGEGKSAGELANKRDALNAYLPIDTLQTDYWLRIKHSSLVPNTTILPPFIQRTGSAEQHTTG